MLNKKLISTLKPLMCLALFLLNLLVFHQVANGQSEVGIPIIRNYTSDDYSAHTQNFDIIEDQQGRVFIANFGGVLMFTGQDWELITTPDISRVTSLGLSADGKVYLGGLNEIGYLEATADGTLEYQDLTGLLRTQDRSFGEVKDIFVQNNTILFFTNKFVFAYAQNEVKRTVLPENLTGVYRFEDEFLWQGESDRYFKTDRNGENSARYDLLSRDIEVTAVLNTESGYILGTASNGLLQLANDLITPFSNKAQQELKSARVTDIKLLTGNIMAVSTQREGTYFISPTGQLITRASRAFGLQNDYINHTFVDSRNRFWLALNNGVSLISYPWPWTKYDINNGLAAGVTSIQRFNGELFVGTYQGLFILNEERKQFQPFGAIDFACWEMVSTEETLLIATSQGVFFIKEQATGRLSEDFTLSLAGMESSSKTVFAGTLTGLQQIDYQKGTVDEVATDLGQITDLKQDTDGSVWLTTLTGRIGRYNPEGEQLKFMGLEENLEELSGNRVFIFDNSTVVSTRNGVFKFDQGTSLFEKILLSADSTNTTAAWPGLISQSKANEAWMTGGDEAGVTLFKRAGGTWQPIPEGFAPFNNFICRVIFQEDEITWFGGPSGLIRYDRSLKESVNTQVSTLISEISINNDSLYFGGAYTEAVGLPTGNVFGFGSRNLNFELSSDAYEAENEALFSYRLQGNDNNWSEWTTDNQRIYSNLSPGEYTFQTRSKNAFDVESEVASFSFQILYPWYLKWYVVTLYVLILTLVVWQIVRWRSRKLIREKERLEKTVKERTAEISLQRDEIQEKSEKLSSALTNLEQAQEELIRKEKLASVGQLTKGIVDRVINPLNYINNFSQLSMELTDELKDLLSDEKASISDEAYEELDEIGGMLSDNLEKINAHGGSTTRMIKAMEEILKDRGGVRTEISLNQLVQQSVNLITHNYKSELEQFGVSIDLDFNGQEFSIYAAQDEIGKCIHQLIDNAVQAVIARTGKDDITVGQVKVAVSAGVEDVLVEIIDTGTGIPEKEIAHIYDPFFTTKTTAKGAGVGLYLVREIVLAHKGKIEVESEVDKGTKFSVHLPMILKEA